MPFSGRNTHPGQAQGSARKRLKRFQKRASLLQQKYRSENDAQRRQDEVKVEVVINDLEAITGSSDWRSAFSSRVRVFDWAAKYFGDTEVNTLDYLRINADINKVSFEREALGKLLSLGYKLEELEVEFDDKKRSGWGICTWYKDHPSYHDEELREIWKGGTPEVFSFLDAMFKTEHAGDQKFTLYSTQMVAAAIVKQPAQVLLHKTLVFRRVVLSLPPSNYAKMAA
ncbi:MAG: hypothetical protein V4436_03250 [Patescibacteria group bacterium]